MNPITLSLIISFVFGTIIGSFLNVVSLRYNSGLGIGGRSKCFTCGKTLTWKELIPLVSFLVQKGACKKCRSKISWQYPLVEFLSGALFLLILFKFPPVSFEAAVLTALYLFITCIMLVITVYDMKHKIIPDPLVFAFGIAALVVTVWLHPHLDMNLVWALLAGPICAFPFAALFYASRGKWIGFGDAKLALGIGWLLGLPAAASAIALAFWIGAAISLIWMYSRFGKMRGNYQIPFAPYLILGMYIVLLFGVSVFDTQALFGSF